MDALERMYSTPTDARTSPNEEESRFAFAQRKPFGCRPTEHLDLQEVTRKLHFAKGKFRTNEPEASMKMR
jgi:hypothetical protein